MQDRCSAETLTEITSDFAGSSDFLTELSSCTNWTYALWLPETGELRSQVSRKISTKSSLGLKHFCKYMYFILGLLRCTDGKAVM